MTVWLKIISILEIAGGIVGIAILVWVVASTPFHPLALILLPVVLGIYGLSLFAGIALFRGWKFGRTASIIVQCIQIPKLVSPALIFMFSFGIDCWVYYLAAAEFSKVGFEFRFGAFNQFFFNAVGAPFGIGISITGCVLLAILLKYKPKDPASIIEATTPPPPMFSQENIEHRIDASLEEPSKEAEL